VVVKYFVEFYSYIGYNIGVKPDEAFGKNYDII